MNLKQGTYKFENRDCMEGMRDYTDKYFDLAIVDPPYGDGGGGAMGWEKEKSLRRTVRKVKRTGGTWSKKYQKGVYLTQMILGTGILRRMMNTLRNYLG